MTGVSCSYDLFFQNPTSIFSLQIVHFLIKVNANKQQQEKEDGQTLKCHQNPEGAYLIG